MKLTVEQLEGRESPVTLQVVPVGDIAAWSGWPVFASALRAFGDRLESAAGPLTPLTQPYTLSHAWGNEPGPSLPPDTMRVYVGRSPTPSPAEYAAAAPGGWSSSGGSLPRSWGGFIALNTTKIDADGVDVGTVARHEFGHVVGLGHSPDAVALMGPNLAPGQVKNANHSDANALDAVGWEITPLAHVPGHSRVYGIGTTANGWMMFRNEDVGRLYPSYTRVPDAGGWAYAPHYAVLVPL